MHRLAEVRVLQGASTARIGKKAFSREGWLSLFVVTKLHDLKVTITEFCNMTRH